MVSNTATISFVLYGIFILITVTGMILAFWVIIKGSLTDEKLTKIIDLFKYSIVTVSIATVTLIVSDLFKEREQDVKELEYFDKYVQDVKKVDGIVQRLQLSKYLALVSPPGEMQKSWQRYLDATQKEFDVYIKDKKTQDSLAALKKPTAADDEKKKEVDRKVNQQESPISNNDFNAASAYEAKGFESLLSKNLNDAIDNFDLSEHAYPSYRNSYDIAKYLKSKRPTFVDDNKSWATIYTFIVSTFKWKIPSEMKAKLTAASEPQVDKKK